MKNIITSAGFHIGEREICLSRSVRFALNRAIISFIYSLAYLSS